MANNILVDLERCTGCWTCAMSCKVAHKLEGDDYWLYVRTLGGSDVDEPGGTYPDFHISWMPIFTKQCILCADRVADGELPHCVTCCTTKALTFGDVTEKKDELIKKGRRTVYFPSWENTRPEIIYMSDGE